MVAAAASSACWGSETPRDDSLPLTTVTVATTPEADQPASTTPGDQAVMRVYDTPPGRARDVASVLQRVLKTSSDLPPRGRVSAMDGDRVTVVAPVELHEGIAALCKEIAKTETSPARTVSLSYWLVEAHPADASDLSAIPALADVLGPVIEHDGPARFTIAEKATVSSLLNSSGRTEGVHAKYQQLATARGDTIIADIDIDSKGANGGSLQTRVSLTPGQTLVVGQGTWQTHDRDRDDSGDVEPRMYYVVRAELADAT